MFNKAKTSEFQNFWYVGLVLSLEHLLTLMFWLTDKPLLQILSQDNLPICWPMFPSCNLFRPSDTALKALLVIYGLMAVASSLLWIWKKVFSASIILLILLSLKIALISLDFRLTGNYHTIPSILAIAFLFGNNLKSLIPVTFVVIYFIAGILKLNTEWINGSVIINSLAPQWFIQIGVWYVLLLELFFVTLLLVRFKKIYLFVLGQLVLFHLFSWHITGPFYPIIMLLLLSILLFYKDDFTGVSLSEKINLFKKNTINKILLVILVIANIQQYFIPGQSHITGEGRLFALNMYDGQVECRPTLKVYQMNLPVTEMLVAVPYLIYRTQCDPLIYLQVAQEACRWAQKVKEVRQLDLKIEVQAASFTEMKTLVSQPDICRNPIKYNWIGSNAWINKL